MWPCITELLKLKTPAFIILIFRILSNFNHFLYFLFVKYFAAESHFCSSRVPVAVLGFRSRTNFPSPCYEALWRVKRFPI